MVEIFLSPHPPTRAFHCPHWNLHAHAKEGKNTEHGMEKIQNGGEKIKG